MNRLTGFFRERPEFLLALCGAVLAFALRYGYFRSYPYPLMLHEQDGIAYMSIARDLLALKKPGNLFMPPFYPLVIAVFSVLPVKFEVAARLASMVMDSLVVLPLYGLARIVLPRGAALTVSILWASFAFSLFFAPSPLSQSTYLCMLLTATWLLYRALSEGGRRWQFALAGACFACAYLTRPEAFVSIAIALCITAAGALRTGADRRAHLVGGGLLLGAFLLASFPYLLLLREQSGHWTFTAKTVVAIKGIDGSLTLGAKTAKSGLALWLDEFGGFSGGMRFIWANFTAFFALLRKSFFPWTGYVAMIGFPAIFIGRNPFNRLFFLVPLLVTVPVYVANLPKNHSYIYPLFPVYMLAFVAGAWVLLGLVRRGIAGLWREMPRHVAEAGATTLLMVPVLYLAVTSCREATANYTSPEYLFQVEQTTKVFKAAGDDIRVLSNPDDKLMTRWGLVSYFAERPLLILPKGGIEEVLDAGRKAGARYLLIDTESVTSRRQELMDLLGPLEGRGVDPRYGIQVVGTRMTDLGGYVIYRYL